MDEEAIEYNEDEYDISEIVIERQDEDINKIMKGYKKKLKQYKTTPTLTKYEKTKVLSERANQINYGSNILIENPEKYSNAYDIAVQELNEKKIPFIIKRPYGNTYEYWKLNDLL
jgi:DNA-directed RNA polymerase subunit K/omega